MCYEIPSARLFKRLRKSGAIIEPINDYSIKPVVINGKTKYRMTIKDEKNESLLVRLKKLIGIG